MSEPTDPRALLGRLLDGIEAWEAQHGAFEPHPALAPDRPRLDAAVTEFLDRLSAPTDGEEDGIYPFFHPRYAGQMLKPPHPVAWAAYAAAARLNPNNHALDGGPATGRMEKEVVADLAAMFGFPPEALGHLTGGGTVANLEALFIARELARETDRPLAIGASAGAHYTHARMAHVLGIESVALPTDARGRLDLDALEVALRAGEIGTVVLTAGTTGLGAVDPIREGLAICRAHGARVHVDAAYGG
ncbi:MAG: aminotransferase class V-fold PLP-dependent enzyme, partial [Bacteroidota bacterium]